MRLAQWIIIGTVSIVMMGCTSSKITQMQKDIQAALDNHDTIQAEKLLEQARVTYPQSDKFTEQQLEVYFAREQYDEIIALWVGLSKKQQEKTLHHYLVSLIKTGKISEAEGIITENIQKDPSSYRYQLKGQLAHVQGLYDQAIEAYDEALRLDQHNQDALMNKAIAFADNGNLYESLDLFDAGLAIHPDNYLLWYNKGTVLSELGYQQRNLLGTGAFSWYGDALRHFQKAYTLNQKDTKTLVRIGITYLDLGQKQKAHDIFSLVLSHEPENLEALFYQGKTYQAEGNNEQARTTYRQLLAIDPTFATAQQELDILETTQVTGNLAQ